MASVYVVHQISTGRRRALKVMHPELAGDFHARRRFQQEARIGSLIDSAHVVEVHAAGIDATSHLSWLVMELLEGETLEERVQQGPLGAGELRFTYQQLCHALAAAHRAGVVHRDLKPENVFVSRLDRTSAPIEVKVLDFGIAKLGHSPLASAPGMTGTPLWMAPEQAMRETVGPAADIWALGLMAFYLLTGRYFWRSATQPDGSVTSVLREILVDAIPTASARAAMLGVAARLPAGFDAWFARCVARVPADRFASVAEMWRELEVLLDASEERAFASADLPTADTLLPPAPDPRPIRHTLLGGSVRAAL
jgi:serine/threonine protein kinase